MSMSDSPSLHQARHPAVDVTPVFPQAPIREPAIGRDFWLRLGLITVALVFLYASVFQGLWDLWMSREDYSHGFLIPLISLYLITRKWGEIRSLPVRPVPVLGFGMILLSLAGLFVGAAGGVITLSSVSFIGILIGLTVLLFGYPYLRVLALPFGYLIFMTPVLDVVVDPLHHPLQLLGAKVVSALFQIAGVPTYLDGTFIHFPNGVLEVAVQCSGAGFLIAILAIGLPLASLALRSWQARVTLLVMALAISIVANWLRVALIGIIGYLTGWGPAVHGPLHILQGMLVYWVGFGALFGGAWVLAKMEGGRARRNKGEDSQHPGPVYQSASQQSLRPWWAAIATLVLAVLYLYGYDRGPVEAKQDFESFPSTVGDWAADGSNGGSTIVTIQGTDQDLKKVYRRADGTAVRLYIAYLNRQTQGKELVNYLTAPLHNHTGMTFLPVGNESLRVNAGFWEENHLRTPIVFWYALDGQAYADRYEAKMATMIQALMHQGSHGALVLMSGMPRTGDQDQDLSVAPLEDFARDLGPVLQSYLR